LNDRDNASRRRIGAALATATLCVLAHGALAQDGTGSSPGNGFGLPAETPKLKLVRYLINPRLRTPDSLAEVFRSRVELPVADATRLDAGAIERLTQPSARGESEYYVALRDVMTEFLYEVSVDDEDHPNLARLIEETDETNYPILAVDARTWTERRGSTTRLATELVFRVFVLNVSGQGEKKVVQGCALHLEDRAVGRAPLAGDVAAAFRASARDALRGKLALSLAMNPTMKPRGDNWGTQRPIASTVEPGGGTR
jgi:hypothetical protein